MIFRSFCFLTLVVRERLADDMELARELARDVAREFGLELACEERLEALELDLERFSQRVDLRLRT